MFDEVFVARVPLELNPQVAVRTRHVDAVLETLHFERFLKRGKQPLQVVCDDRQVEVEADDEGLDAIDPAIVSVSSYRTGLTNLHESFSMADQCAGGSARVEITQERKVERRHAVSLDSRVCSPFRASASY